MQSDEDFNVRFVNIVKQHRCLYDKKVPEYRNKDEQEKAWQQIAAETKEYVSHCKERWRNLRACLSRYIKQQNSSDPQHKPYYLTEHMQFLFPFLKLNRLSRSSALNKYNYTSEASLDIKPSDTEETVDPDFMSTMPGSHRPSETDTTPSVNALASVQQSEANEPEHEVLFSTSTERIQHDAKRIKLDHQPNTNTSSILYTENSDMDFFRSILPDIQGMSSLQKRKLKIGILELIDHVLVKYPEKQ